MNNQKPRMKQSSVLYSINELSRMHQMSIEYKQVTEWKKTFRACTWDYFEPNRNQVSIQKWKQNIIFRTIR